MSTCAIQPLLSDGRCFSLACLSRDSQVVVELELLRQIAGYEGTVQELLDRGKCFSDSCISRDSQIVAELQLWCDLFGSLLTCFEVTTETTDDTGSGDGTATATPVGGVGPFSYSWSNGQTTQTATGLTGGTSPVGDYDVLVTDDGAPVCARGANVHIDLAGAGCVPVTDALIYTASLFVDPFAVLWTVVGGTVTQDPMNANVTATGSITSVSIPGGIFMDGTMDLSPLGSCLKSFNADETNFSSFSIAGLPNLTLLALQNTGVLPSFTGNSATLQLFAIYNSAGITSITLNCPAMTYCGPQFNPNLTVIDLTGSNAINNFAADGCALDVTNVDGILAHLNASGILNGLCKLENGTNAAPTGGGANADLLALVANGWTVTTN